MSKVETQRVDIRIPTAILEKIEEYQAEEAFSTRTSALLDLVRKGFQYVEEKKKENN